MRPTERNMTIGTQHPALADLPDCWQGRKMAVDIEAKARELAVVKLMAELQERGWEVGEKR